MIVAKIIEDRRVVGISASTGDQHLISQQINLIGSIAVRSVWFQKVARFVFDPGSLGSGENFGIADESGIELFPEIKAFHKSTGGSEN